ncbi:MULTISPECIES: type II CAAX endopeptidase family protein [unclassified Staphylococcus]|uniref:CPBP family intramembrane glutamic endopeptidase n=1 Tax=unclassified Staphylococcus TaxID=91994 RepID=UPI0021D3DB43|nr:MULTISPECIES: type II CAAX endopeptidase family protein [unclassified Staphylococcus]UXR78706.1 CPBP family intramembrane metalloprotease [Staphylococcus sp. IVB6227]UXR82865.1 CPBP family intramembrane metalloprotease [Staphylococcus sp. IVB6214]
MFHTSTKVVWRDLCAFVIYILGQVTLPFMILTVFTHLKLNMPEPIMLMIGIILTSIFVILFLIVSHRQQFRSKLVIHLKDLRQHIKLIVFTYIGYLLSNAIFMAIMTQLPTKWQFKDTGNQDSLMIFFEQPIWLPFVFLGIVILTPMTEELLFRHVLIGELGKKFGVGFMSILSVVSFALLHMQTAHSPLEIIPYLLLGTMFTITYVKSNGNIIVAIVTHIMNNGIAFIAILQQMT